MYTFTDPRLQKKHPWRAAAETFGMNVGVWAFDRYVMNEDFAKISIGSIRRNIKHGFVWDNDQFSTNLFAHPYHGNLYFNAARSNGLTFWESAPYAFAGSLMWEIAAEVEPPAINDLMATTLGGIALGEVTHRMSSLVLDDSKRGFSRFTREFLGTIKQLGGYRPSAFWENALAGAAIGACTILCCAISIQCTKTNIIVGSLMPFVPGVACTNGLRDYMAGDLVSGNSRIAEALLFAISIAIGQIGRAHV